jgi:hypothetical protein
MYLLENQYFRIANMYKILESRKFEYNFTLVLQNIKMRHYFA